MNPDALERKGAQKQARWEQDRRAEIEKVRPPLRMTPELRDWVERYAVGHMEEIANDESGMFTEFKGRHAAYFEVLHQRGRDCQRARRALAAHKDAQ